MWGIAKQCRVGTSLLLLTLIINFFLLYWRTVIPSCLCFFKYVRRFCFKTDLTFVSDPEPGRRCESA